MAVLAAIAIAGMLIAISWTESAQEWRERRAQLEILHDINATPLTAEQQGILANEYALCETEADNREDSTVCWQTRYDLRDKFKLENYYAIQRDHHIQQPRLEHSVSPTLITANQRNEIVYRYFSCVIEGGGYESITQEDLDACDQTRYDLMDEFMLENHYANQSGP